MIGLEDRDSAIELHPQGCRLGPGQGPTRRTIHAGPAGNNMSGPLAPESRWGLSDAARRSQYLPGKAASAANGDFSRARYRNRTGDLLHTGETLFLLS